MVGLGEADRDLPPPLYAARRTLHTGSLLRPRWPQVSCWVRRRHRSKIAAYREPDRTRGRELMSKLIDSLQRGVPPALNEVVTLGRTLNNRAVDILAYFDRPGTSNGPTEATNGRLEHLRGSDSGFRNLTDYIARSLLETGWIQTPTTPCIVKSRL